MLYKLSSQSSCQRKPRAGILGSVWAGTKQTKLAPRSTTATVSSATPDPSKSRRRSSASKTAPPAALQLDRSLKKSSDQGATSGLQGRGSGLLSSIPGTPLTDTMSLSRSPSPRAGGGWSSPGLASDFNSISGRSSPRKTYPDLYMNGSAASGSGSVTWASAKAKSDEVNGYPSFSTRKTGFFSRHARRISNSLPRFNLGGRRDFSDREKLGRGRWYPNGGSKFDRFKTFVGNVTRRMKLRLLIVLLLLLSVILFNVTRMYRV